MHPLTLSVLSLLFATPIPQAPLAGVAPARPLQAVSPSPRLAWGDFDGDGLRDLAKAHGRGVELLRNQGDGGFADITQVAGVPPLAGAGVVAWVDVDRDGDLDLFVGSASGAHLLKNDGGGTFLDATASAGLDGEVGATSGAAWIDYDADGWPDLQLSTEHGDVLLRNVGGGVFEPVELGLGTEESVVVVRTGSEEPASASRPGTQAVGAAPGGFSAVPNGTRAAATVVGICAGSIFDQALGACIPASMVPALGSLMPLSIDLNVDLAGNVGMGTSSPASKLHVVGDLRAEGQLISTASSGAPLSVASSDLVTGLNADLLDGVEASAFSQLGNEIEGSEIADGTITSADLAPGAVGSGGIAPAAVGPTELAADAVTSAKLAPGAVDTTKIADGTLLNGDVASNAAIAGTKVNPQFGSQTVSTTGSIGAGTSTPEVRLHAAGGSDVSPTGGGYLQLGNQSSSNLAFDDNEIMARSASAPADLFLNNEGGDVIVSPAGTGRLGVGTSSPLFDVHVRGNTPLGTLLVTPSVSDSQSEVRLAENQTASLGMILRYNGTNNDLEVRGYGTGGESDVHFFADRDSGVAGFPTAAAKVGIGTASPSAKLHVVDSTGGDSSVKLPTGSISSAEMLNEAGIAVRRETLDKTISSLIGNAPQKLSSRAINCPSNGYVIAFGSFVLRSTDVVFNGGADALVSISQDNSTNHNSNNSISIGANSSEGDASIVVGTFSVSQGQHTFDLLANKFAGPDAEARDVRLTLQFVPTAYGAVSVD